MRRWPPRWPRTPENCCSRCARRLASTTRTTSATRATSGPTTLILDRLQRDRPDDAVLSEEAVDDLSRVHADRVWIVDPVDGTREFSWPGANDWAVHIALWQRRAGRRPSTAAASPTPRSRCRRAARCTAPTPSPPRRRAREGPIRITASASRPPAVLWRLRDRMDIQLVRIGSAGAKAMAVVRGDVDAYVHAGGQWEWDSAAPAGRGAGRGAARIAAGRLAADLQPARPVPARPADVPRRAGRCPARRHPVDVSGPLIGNGSPLGVVAHVRSNAPSGGRPDRTP